MERRKIAVKSTKGYHDHLDGATKATASGLRRLVARAAPQRAETHSMGVPHWAGNDFVLYIADYTNHVNLGFHHGAKIKDGTGLLEGMGKGLRHVKAYGAKDVREKELAGLLRQAIELDGA